jgi:ABC-type Na+ efflux pump permease subunit
MFTKKRLILACLPLLLASFLSAQSVTDLAKKEKERRAAVKNKPASVITNADLAKMKKRPAVETAEPDKPAAETAPPAGPQGAASLPADQTRAGQKTDEQKAAEQAALSEKDFKARLSELATKAQQAQEMIDLLTLKMNSLWQEFYDLNSDKLRDSTKFQISETYDRLTKAEVEATRAKKELDDFLATAKREGVPQIWIK